jgi:hypothetical protein
MSINTGLEHIMHNTLGTSRTTNNRGRNPLAHVQGNPQHQTQPQVYALEK